MTSIYTRLLHWIEKSPDPPLYVCAPTTWNFVMSRLGTDPRGQSYRRSGRCIKLDAVAHRPAWSCSQMSASGSWTLGLDMKAAGV